MTISPTWISDQSTIDDPLGYGERAVNFLRRLKHPKSKAPGKAFELFPWQERMVRKVYGPRHPDGTRIVRTVVALIPRGGRKTAIGAGLGLLHAIGPERVPGGLVLCAASDRAQARLCYEEAVGIVRQDARIEAALQIKDYRHEIRHPKSGSTLRAISCDAARQHGTTPVFAVIDELHAWAKRDLWDVLRTGLVKTPSALAVIITTAGRGQENIAHDIVDYARKVQLGEIDDPATLPILFEADRDCDWRDEAIWHTVNPGLAYGFPDLAGLRQLAREAEERPADREAFRQLHLNIWLDHSSAPFVDMAVYDQGAASIDLDALRGQDCWLAVDLSSNLDLTVIVAAWRDGDDGYIVHPWFFCPADNLRARADRDKVPYPQWAADGLLEATPGNVVDYRAVEGRIRELCQTYNVREIIFDPHLAQQTMTNLGDEGFPVVAMRQGWISMAPAVKELERAIVGRKFTHGGHPVLRWNFENIAVEVVDKAGNQSFHKGKSRDRIDGAVASAMAVIRAQANLDQEISIFDRPELWKDKPQPTPAVADNSTDWSPEIIADIHHPLFKDHARRFERWQSRQED